MTGAPRRCAPRWRRSPRSRASSSAVRNDLQRRSGWRPTRSPRGWGAISSIVTRPERHGRWPHRTDRRVAPSARGEDLSIGFRSSAGPATGRSARREEPLRSRARRWLRPRGLRPILLRGFIIGTLTLGDQDRPRVCPPRLQQSFDCDVMIVAGDKVVSSTLPSAIAPARLAA